MYSKVPKLSIKIDQILLKGKESKFSANVNSECGKDFFSSSVNNSYDVTSYSIVNENNLSDADKIIIDELHDILSDDANFYPSDKLKSVPSSLALDNNHENFENQHLDYFELDWSAGASPSKVSVPSLQLQGNQKCDSNELDHFQLFDKECANIFSTQIYSSNNIFENDYIYDGVLDEIFLDENDPEKNNLNMMRELKVAVVKLSDEEILSYVNPKIPESVENNLCHYVLRKELRVVLKKMTNEEINAHVNANISRNNKTIDFCSLKKLKVLLTDIKSPELAKKNKDTLYATQDIEYYERNISIFLHSDNDHFSANSLKASFDNTENKSKRGNNSEDLDYNVGSSNKLQKTEKKNSRYKRKRKIEEDLDDDHFQAGKVFAHLPGFNNNETAAYGNELAPFIQHSGTIILIKNETILKRSARIYTANIYKILFAGKYVYNDNYQRTIQNFGGKVVSDPKIATVLVAKKLKRTTQFLSAICRGIPIVSIDWIHEGVENHGFVDPNNYLLKDIESEKKYNFTLKKSLERAREKRIFEGYSFIITSGFQKKSFDQLKYLIQMAGGLVFKNICKNLKPPAIIVTCLKDKKRVHYLMKKKPNYFERTVSLNFIVECIIKQEICSEQV